MRLLTPAQALELDRLSFSGRPGLSERFIEKAAEGLVKALRGSGWDLERALVLAGPGHNGDDGRRVTALLRDQAVATELIEIGSDRWNGLGPAELESRTVIVDAMFGVGLNRPLEGRVVEVVEWIERARRKGTRVLAVDVPSGLDAGTGEPRGAAVRADLTVTMQAAKPGFFLNEGPLYTGRLIRHLLPYDLDLFRRLACTHFAFGERAAGQVLPARRNLSHKGSHGTLNLVAGSRRYPGAGVLAARAALRTGVGYLRLVQNGPLYPEWFQIPETLFVNLDSLPRPFSKDEAWVIGPGSVEEEIPLVRLLRELLDAGCRKVLLDASALTALKSAGIRAPDEWILTPHPKELSRLIEIPVAGIQRDRLSAAAQAAETWGGTVLLKGYKTVVRSGAKSDLILRGNGALAKAGTGDVLAGMIGSLRAQGLGARESADLGAYLHGLAADLWCAQGRDKASLTPGDLIETIPAAISRVRTSRPRRS